MGSRDPWHQNYSRDFVGNTDAKTSCGDLDIGTFTTLPRILMCANICEPHSWTLISALKAHIFSSFILSTKFVPFFRIKRKKDVE